MSLVDRLAAQLAPRVRPAQPVREAAKPAAVRAPVAETGSKSVNASGTQARHAPSQPPPPQPSSGWRGSCRAVSAETGRACALLAGHQGPHRHGSTAFIRTAEVGQTHFTRRAALDTAASSRLVDSTLTHGAP